MIYIVRGQLIAGDQVIRQKPTSVDDRGETGIRMLPVRPFRAGALFLAVIAFTHISILLQCCQILLQCCKPPLKA